VKRFGPFRLEALLEQLQRWEAIVRAELGRIDVTDSVPHRKRRTRRNDTESDARPGDILLVDTRDHNVTAWLPEAIPENVGAQILLVNMGTNYMIAKPRAGTIHGGSAASTRTQLDSFWCVSLGEPEAGWIRRT
jgi:hypothetical protein